MLDGSYSLLYHRVVVSSKGLPRGWNNDLSLTLNVENGSRLHVSLAAKGKSAIPLKRPAESGVVAGYWRISTLVFWVSPCALAGRYDFEIPEDPNEAKVSRFVIGPMFPDRPSVDTTLIFSQRFGEMLHKGALLLAQMQGRWTPPGQTIYLRDGDPVRASRNGHFVPLRADFGKSRLGERTWQHPDEINRIVELLKLAEQLVRTSQGSNQSSDIPQSANQADIEKWIADKSGIWSPGTVHLQLQIARQKGKIKPRKRGRKKST